MEIELSSPKSSVAAKEVSNDEDRDENIRSPSLLSATGDRIEISDDATAPEATENEFTGVELELLDDAYPVQEPSNECLPPSKRLARHAVNIKSTEGRGSNGATDLSHR